MKPCNLTKDQMLQITERLESHQSTVTSESKTLGFTGTSPLREWLSDALGRDRYLALLHGPKAKNGAAACTVPRELPDDSKLPTVASMGKTEGWSWRWVSEHEPRPVRVDLGKNRGAMTVMDGGDRLVIMIDPDGREFIEALPSEKADLLRAPTEMRAEVRRFVLYEHSQMRKRIEKNTEAGVDELQRGQDAQKAKREQRKAEPLLLTEAAAQRGKPAKQTAAMRKATHAVAVNHPRSTRLDPKVKTETAKVAQLKKLMVKKPAAKKAKPAKKAKVQKSRKSTKSSSRRSK